MPLKINWNTPVLLFQRHLEKKSQGVVEFDF